jgi:hypothetical protein
MASLLSSANSPMNFRQAEGIYQKKIKKIVGSSHGRAHQLPPTTTSQLHHFISRSLALFNLNILHSQAQSFNFTTNNPHFLHHLHS